MSELKEIELGVVIPVGPDSIAEALDTLDSIDHYLLCRKCVVVVDDCTDDGTLLRQRQQSHPDLVVLRNQRRNGMQFLSHSLAAAYRYLVANYRVQTVLKLDTDALLIGYGLEKDAKDFMLRNPDVGIFGLHSVNADLSVKDYRMHTELIQFELSLRRRLRGYGPWYRHIAKKAVENGWGLGDNVFGGAYFLTTRNIRKMEELGYLNPPYKGWNSSMAEDVYFSMCTVAAGFQMGQFAAPCGPLALDWKELPHPAAELLARGYKLVHSVDRGSNTTPERNGGLTAREVFRHHRLHSQLTQASA
ncbi:MAG: hypothetical protein IRZ15_10790 [Bryobacteraceae bacterium]|nr:hypothetical protein [Bryobacteraceae bacterium]